MSDEYPTPTRAEEVAQGLRELADWLCERPDMPVMFALVKGDHAWASDERERFLALLGGFDGFTPERIGQSLNVRRMFAGGVAFQLGCEGCVFHTTPPVPAWPEEIRALAPDADWGEGS